MTEVRLILLARRRRILSLLAFSALFLLAAGTAHLVAGHDGHVEADRLFAFGGYPLVSAMLLLGWLIARFPMIAALVMLAGVFSDDRASGHARLYRTRPSNPLLLYGRRAAVLAGFAFLLSATLLPIFDFLMLGTWIGGGALAVILTHTLVYGSLAVLFSVWTRADAWLALLMALTAMLWLTLRQAGALVEVPTFIREVVTFLLPPQAALGAIEAAFATRQAVPWDAVLYVLLYTMLALFVAAVALRRREI
jgi:hypothetical protein